MADFLVIAEAVLGVNAESLGRSDRVVALAESALMAPTASYGGVEFYPDLGQKAALVYARLARNHPLPDGNKRVAFACMVEFIERNGRVLQTLSDDTTESVVQVLESVASGAIPEAEFVGWVTKRLETAAPPGVPEVGKEDRSQWRYEDNGPPLAAAAKLLELLCDPEPSSKLPQIRQVVTRGSWPRWEAAIRQGLPASFINQLNHVSTKVRYPADGMAFVFCLVTHPDHNETFVVDSPTPAWMHPITLIEEEGNWKVHQLGGDLIPPSELGKEPYSW